MTEPEAAHTEADEGLTETFQQVLGDHEFRPGVCRCGYRLPLDVMASAHLSAETARAHIVDHLTAAVEQIIRDRLAPVEALHHPSQLGNWCQHDCASWPCKTIAALRGER